MRNVLINTNNLTPHSRNLLYMPMLGSCDHNPVPTSDEINDRTVTWYCQHQNTQILIFSRIGSHFPKIRLLYWCRHFEFLNYNHKFIMYDFKKTLRFWFPVDSDFQNRVLLYKNKCHITLFWKRPTYAQKRVQKVSPPRKINSETEKTQISLSMLYI